jgi:iron complex outermembrane receptor protein
VSLLALNTKQENTGGAIIDGVPVNLDGKRVADVPAFKVNGDWQFAGKKAFDEENTVFVPKYHLFNLGTSYATRVNGMPLALRAQVRNALDKFYWRDVTPDLGGYLIPGLGRTFRVSAQLFF